jgi:hypothetical protein
LGNIPEAKQAVTQAIRSDPILLHDPKRMPVQVVDFGFNHATAGTSLSGARDFVKTVFANLPSNARTLLRFKAKAMGRVCARLACASYDTGDFRAVRREVPLAFIHDRSLLKERAIWSIFLRSFVAARNIGRRKKHQLSAR